MFTKFRIRNFRTHIDTEIEVKDLTLLIGSNNSGKTNLLEGLRFFSEILAEGNQKVTQQTFFEHIRRLSMRPSISFYCDWEGTDDSQEFVFMIQYHLTLSCFKDEMIHNEKLLIKMLDIYNTNGESEETLENKNNSYFSLQEEMLNDEKYQKFHNGISSFFHELTRFQYFHFQPLALKSSNELRYKENTFDKLDAEGYYFIPFLKKLQKEEHNSPLYNKLISLIRRFENSFIGFQINEESQILWQFDMGDDNYPAFTTDKVSDGLLKAAAVALLCTIKNKHSIIMLEEIENGINQKKLAEFLKWLRLASKNHGTQFILTSHSPSVIREFADKLDCVYNVHLKKKKGYVSDVVNLSEALKPLVKFGAIKEEEVEERNGVIHLRPHTLTELFYNGVLAEL
ncbi:MAG: AAA family ATPase [Bacteroidia bacterium]